jgi:arginine/serine-rich splicing factor 2
MSERDRKVAPNVEGMTTLKVDNISKHTTPDILKDMFGAYGEVGDVYIPRNYNTNEARGFAFVRYLDKRDAEDAQRALDGKDVDGREIRIAEAKERRAENPREAMMDRRGNDRGGGYGGGRDRYNDNDRRGGQGRDFDRRDRRDSRDFGRDNRDDRRGGTDRGGDRGGINRDRPRSRSRSRSPAPAPRDRDRRSRS